MAGLVEQLQIEALDKGIELSTLLRRAKLAAVKLGLQDAVAWVDAELNGYVDNVPEYRKVSGEAVYWNPYHGWQPLAFDDANMGAAVSKRWVMEPVTSLEETLKGDSTTLMVHFGSDILSALNRMAQISITRAGLMVGRGSLVAILEHVRNQVFEWAMGLEAAGVTGEGISFSREEKQRASTAQIHIGSFHGSLNTGELSGPNARLNYQSEDRSTNISVADSLFGEIENALVGGISDSKEREKITDELHALRDATGREERLSAYQRLIASAANHMTILAPFLPSLASVVG